MRKAIEMTRLLPPPGELPDELTAQCIFEGAFGVEFFGDDDLAIELYRRVLAYAVVNTKYVASAWFRLGVCTCRQGNLAEAIHCYREALRLAVDLPHMVALACYNLADLLEAAEAFAEAADSFAKVFPLLPHPDINDGQVFLAFARCSWRATRDIRAIATLETLTRDPEDAVSAEAWRLLAEIAEENQDYFEADRAYREIISNPHSDRNLRAAAVYRLEALGRRSSARR